MPVPMLDLKRQYRPLHRELLDAVAAVLETQQFILGEPVAAFEKAAAAQLGVTHAVGCSSGTDALWLALAAAGIGPPPHGPGPVRGDPGPGMAVVTSPFSFFASVSAILRAGATPVLADIEPTTFNLDPSAVETVLNGPRGAAVRAILPVHLYGQPVEWTAFARLSQEHGLKLIEDAAQAWGAEWNGVKVGALGELAAFSFYPTKNLGAYGDGGGVVTADRAVYDRIVKLRNYGQKEKHLHEIDGFNSRLDELQAAILSVKLAKLDAANERRRRLADIYRMDLEDECPVALPVERPWARHVYHLYVIRAKERDELSRFLKSRDIGSLVHYPTPVHLQETYRHLGYKKGAFPEAEKAASEILSLPLYPGLRDDEVVFVSTAIKAFYAR